jgi:hypothetical protein
MKKIAIFLICFVPVALLFLVFTFRFKPDGNFYFTFLTHTPVIIAGDGSSYQSAYQLRHGRAIDLTTSEVQTIRDRYWIGSNSNTLHFAITNLNGRAYDVVSFMVSNDTKTVYFDVTSYKTRTQP